MNCWPATADPYILHPGIMRTPSDILRRAYGPGQVLARARAHARLQRQLLPELPPELAAHARVACVRDKTLVMAAESPVWATRLKLYSNELLAAARGAWPGGIQKLKVVVVRGQGPVKS